MKNLSWLQSLSRAVLSFLRKVKSVSCAIWHKWSHSLLRAVLIYLSTIISVSCVFWFVWSIDFQFFLLLLLVALSFASPSILFLLFGLKFILKKKYSTIKKVLYLSGLAIVNSAIILLVAYYQNADFAIYGSWYTLGGIFWTIIICYFFKDLKTSPAELGTNNGSSNGNI